MPAPLDPLVKAQRENERLRIDNANLRSLNKKLLRRGGGFDEFIEELKDIVKSGQHFKYTTTHKVPEITPFEPDHEEIAAVPSSDLHLAEEVRLDDSNGINIYNPMVAANRLWLHSQKVISLLQRHMQMYKITGIWSPLLGDMISGSIHPEFIITNTLTDPSAVILCARLLKMFYTEIMSLGLPVVVDGIVGNHPRLTHKFPTKRVAHTNYDWLMYEYLSDMFGGDEQIKFNLHTSQIGMRKIYGWNYVFEHGVQVSSGKEEGFEDRVRAMLDDPVFRNATGYAGASFDQIVIGNMHKPKMLERTVVNGSYVGQNELGQSWRLKPIKAMQALWGISKKHVRTFSYMIDLTDMRSDKALNPMSEYTKWFLSRHGK